MQYLNMLPYQVREAIDKNVPAVMPLGVVEYHGEHLPLGTDTFVCQEIVRRIEKRHPEIVVLPTFYYGCASYAVAKPERNGSIQVDMTHIIPMAEDIFTSLLRVGFRNIHCFIAHQTEEFEQGMPTDLAFRAAGRHVIFNWLEKERGEGWWGDESSSDYYSGDNNPFHWIRIHPCLPLEEDRKKFEGDHAGIEETSMDMVICPELVEMARQDDALWFTRTAKGANRPFGEEDLESAAVNSERLIYSK